MEKLEMRVRARAAARAAGLFDLAQLAGSEGLGEMRASTSTTRVRRHSAPAWASVDETQARAACAPMGVLEYVVQAANTKGRVRAMYVIAPDPTMAAHYERLGLVLESGCRVLLDAATLLPMAVLKLSRTSATAPEPGPPASGFNPFFDVPVA